MAAEQNEQVYDQIAREAIEHALGRTFENPEAVPRRDAFIRDATDLLARFVAARCGNPGFHSARFFDAVIALSNARTRIRDAARRSRVVERLVEAERRVRALENALKDRNEQLVQASSGSDATTLARAIADADARIRTLEHELSEARNRAADPTPHDERRDEGLTAPTRHLDQLDAEEIFRDTADTGDETGEETGKIQIDIPPDPRRREPPRDPVPNAPASRDLEPERRLAALKAKFEDLRQEMVKLRTEKEQVELERDALHAQMEQVTQREGPLREAKAAIGRERDALVARVAELEKERDHRIHELESERDGVLHERDGILKEKHGLEQEKGALERERDEIVRSRSSLAELKRQVEQELGLAQQDREQLRAVAADKETARTRAIAEGERAHEARRAAEARIDRESTAAARARRERDDARAERDRLRAASAELAQFKDRWEQLASALGADPAAPLEAVLDMIARRHEVVLAHEPPAWDELRARLERLGAKDGLAEDARAWVARLDEARGRYAQLVAGASNGGATASALLEIARIVTAREEEARALDLLESVVARI